MATNEKLNSRVRELLAHLSEVEEKRMFRGITFMVNGKMCISAGDDSYMFRIDPAMHEELLKRPGCSTVIMKGREYKGYVRVKDSSVPARKQLAYWVSLALEFNKKLLQEKKQ